METIILSTGEEIKLYTTNEIAPKLKCSKVMLDRKCKAGIFPAFKFGRNWVIEEENLKEYLKTTRGEVR
ncbi:MAG: helix-turn-helix domain-containing protein [Clostridia bacterium]|nr:helix-turn-helix domain-containing protein [Clostridia bacterium]